MSTSYWPWWLGGLLLASVAILFPLLTGSPLGVSGALARLFRWRGDTEGCTGADPASAPTDAGPDRAGNLAFLASVVVGGAIAGQVGGVHWGETTLSPEFYRLFGHGIGSWLVLFGGGILVGVGTRVSGGCTSGHGLSGCGRLQPASLVATATFFGVAIGVSFLLEKILS